MFRVTKLLSAASAVALLVSAAPAHAAMCVTDMDCPGAACGGQVCQWLSTTNHVCQDAGSKSHGSDGWCNTVADCKCQSVGAKCNAQFSCSFVLAADAPPAGGAGGMSGAGAGGAAPSGGVSAGGASGSAPSGGESNGGLPSGGTAGGGTPSAGTSGAISSAGGGTPMPEGPITGSPSAPDAGGCAVSGPSPRSNGLFGLIFGGLALFAARRRRGGARVHSAAAGA